MARKTVKKEEDKSLLWSIVKLPYTIYKKGKRKQVEKKIRKHRETLTPQYEPFQEVHKFKGDLNKWEVDLLNSESKIGIVLGARGSGKTAFSLKLIENIYAKKRRPCYAIGFRKAEMPAWVKVVENISEIENGAIVLIDEGGVLFNSRRSMTTANKLLGELILIARHKNLSILFISQNSSNLDVNILRQADYLVLKPSSLLQKDFERKKIKQIYDEVDKYFEKYSDKLGITYIYSDKLRGFITNQLPSFWNVRISKSFSGR